MSGALTLPEIERDAPIPTYFNVGGGADRMVRPASVDELRACLLAEPDLRILGDGANLLVDDDGVSELVVRLDHPAFRGVEINEATGIVTVGGGADLAKLIHATVRAGLTGLEGLIGVPASLGGAAFMNAGGTYGQMSDIVRSVTALNPFGELVRIPRERIAYAYRTSGLFDLIITEVELHLTPGDPEAARARLKDIMEQKARTQPLAARTCGCVFRNPVLRHDIEGLGEAHQRISAGLLIDRAGGKGMAAGPCAVSQRHANFIETAPGASASDILRLIDKIKALVSDHYDVTLETEVVIWRRSA